MDTVIVTGYVRYLDPMDGPNGCLKSQYIYVRYLDLTLDITTPDTPTSINTHLLRLPDMGSIHLFLSFILIIHIYSYHRIIVSFSCRIIRIYFRYSYAYDNLLIIYSMTISYA